MGEDPLICLAFHQDSGQGFYCLCREKRSKNGEVNPLNPRQTIHLPSAPLICRSSRRLPQSTPGTGPPCRATRRALTGPRIWSNRIRIARPGEDPDALPYDLQAHRLLAPARVSLVQQGLHLGLPQRAHLQPSLAQSLHRLGQSGAHGTPAREQPPPLVGEFNAGTISARFRRWSRKPGSVHPVKASGSQ